MSGAPLITEGELTTALSWVSAGVLNELTWEVSILTEAEALVAAALAVEVDIVWVPASREWAPRAASLIAAEGMRPAWAVDGPLGRVAETLGWAETLRLTAAEPDRLAAPLDRALQDVLTDVRAGQAAGCDLLVVGDDLAGASGWLLSPDFALDLLVPAYLAVSREWARTGESIFHSDGDVRALMPGLRQAGFSGIHLASVAPDSFEATVRTAWRAGLTPFGGLPAATLEGTDISLHATRAAALAAIGPLVVSDDGGITTLPQVDGLASALAIARSAFGSRHT